MNFMGRYVYVAADDALEVVDQTIVSLVAVVLIAALLAAAPRRAARSRAAASRSDAAESSPVTIVRPSRSAGSGP